MRGDAPREHVRACIDVTRTDPLLGRHVARGAEDRARARQRRIARFEHVALQLGQAEVEQLHSAGRGLAGAHEKDVRRFDVAMNHAPLMGGGEGLQHASRDVVGVVEREHPLAREARFERLAFEQRHHEKGLAALVVADVDDIHDSLVSQRGERARFEQESADGALVRSAIGAQPLEREAPSEQLVTNTVDHAHAALAEQAFDAVSTRDSLSGQRGLCAGWSDRSVSTGPRDPRAGKASWVSSRERPDDRAALETARELFDDGVAQRAFELAVDEAREEIGGSMDHRSVRNEPLRGAMARAFFAAQTKTR